jgi:RNA polymerase sigma factor (TIGR02999 family)
LNGAEFGRLAGVGADAPIPDRDSPKNGLAETVYRHLREIAQRQMQGERRGHTLTATALVSEAYLRLVPGGVAPADRAEFYYAAAGAMRRILIDHARARGTDKRGGSWKRLEVVEDVADLASAAAPEDLLALDEAVSRLESADPGAAAVVRLRFYAGLSGDQAAEILGISARQVDREWSFARAFLVRVLHDTDGKKGDATQRAQSTQR